MITVFRDSQSTTLVQKSRKKKKKNLEDRKNLCSPEEPEIGPQAWRLRAKPWKTPQVLTILYCPIYMDTKKIFRFTFQAQGANNPVSDVHILISK